MERLIEEKHACGYRYITSEDRLRHLDRFLCEEGLSAEQLPRILAERWMASRPHETAGTQRPRIASLRQLARFLARHDIPAHLPEYRSGSVTKNHFTPWIFRREEVRQILEAVDALACNGRVPFRHRIMPEIFRLLYGCGLRVSEVLRLTVADVDLDQGVLTIRQSKFRKDRYVPMAPSQVLRLQRYDEWMGERAGGVFFFPAPDGGPYSRDTIYGLFRQLLRACGIPHEGRGRGPRLHDLRATFAVHRLESWYRQGVDLGAKLPVLAVYMGHQSLIGTQRYLHLTAELFPDIAARLDDSFGHVIPRRVDS
jgi:integrase